MNDFQFVSETYDIQNISEYRLSIQFNLDGFSVLTAGRGGEILQLMHFNTGGIERSLELFRQKEELDLLLRLSFRKVHLMINTGAYILVPESLFDPNFQQELLAASLEIKSSDHVLNCKSGEFPSRIVFILDPSFRSLISLFKNNPVTAHLASAWISNSMKTPVREKGLFIHSSGGMVHIALKKAEKLIFFNSFRADTAEDVLYHSLNVLKQNHAEEDTTAFYAGEFEKESREFRVLKKYLGGISMLPSRLPFEIAGRINENYFLNLIEISTCAS